MNSTSSIFILEHIVITSSKKGGGRVTVTDLRLFEERIGSPDDLTQTLRLGLVEPRADEVGTVGSWVRTGGRGWKRYRIKHGRIFEMEQWVRKVIQSRRYAHGGSRYNIHMMASIRGKGRANVESTKGMLVPGFTDKGGNMGVTELASRVDRMGKKVTRLAV
jgi:hypothetical protein